MGIFRAFFRRMFGEKPRKNKRIETRAGNEPLDDEALALRVR